MIEQEKKPLVIVVEDNPDASALVERWLHKDYELLLLEDAESCLEELETSLPATVCLDLDLPGTGGLDALAEIHSRYPHLPVLILTANRDVETVVKALQSGAFDYLPKPLDKTKLQTTLRNAVDRYRMTLRLAELERQTAVKSYAGILGQSPPMRRLFSELERLAQSDVTVLLHGESGTGKELVAQAVHNHSRRQQRPFIAVNCAAIPENLVESEFFGHERGAFTGATAQRKGRLEQAHGGTLFLDEVAELDPGLQAKLLRVLQERSFHRVGGNVEIQSDFRVVAASHRDLATEAAEGRFRQDLYFRLAVFEVEIPPLRAREGDVGFLVDHFLELYAEGAPPKVSEEARALLLNYEWPGNVRELQNAMQRAVVACSSGTIEPSDLPSRLRSAGAEPTAETETATSASVALRSEASMPERLEEMERQALVQAIEKANGNVALAARSLGIGRTTIYRKMKRFGIEPRGA